MRDIWDWTPALHAPSAKLHGQLTREINMVAIANFLWRLPQNLAKIWTDTNEFYFFKLWKPARWEILS